MSGVTCFCRCGSVKTSGCRVAFESHADPQINAVLDGILASGFEAIPSIQVRGLYAVSFPVLDRQGHGIAAITVPYAERIDQRQRKTVPEVQVLLGIAARELTSRIGGIGNSPKKTGDAAS
jgi:DNA-binding IclR family transcriptional regulator